VIKDGPVNEVIPHYQNIVFKKSEEEVKHKMSAMDDRVRVAVRSLVDIMEVNFLDGKSDKKERFMVGDSLIITFDYEAIEKIDSPIFTLEIIRADGVLCCSSRTDELGVKVDVIQGKGEVKIDLGKNLLAPGIYMVKLSIWDKEMIHPYIVRNKDVIRVEMSGGSRKSEAVFMPEIKWKING
jgi:hypothetical protein